MQISVVGSINTDITIRVPRFSRRNETVVGVGDYVVSQGGKGANQAAAAAAAGGIDVFMVGKVGADDFGARAIENLESLGVNCDFVSRSKDHATGLATILVDDNGDNSITVAPGANWQITEAEIGAAQSIIAGSQIVMVQLEIPLPAIDETVRLAKKGGALVVLDPAPAPARPLSCFPFVDYLTPNENEAEAVTGMTLNDARGASEIADALLRMGVKNVALTLGARGSYIAGEAVRELLQPYKVVAVDSTGAGDVFTGFLAASLAKGLTFLDSARIASAAAALSVTRPGARSHLPTWSDVETFMVSAKGGR